MMDMKHSFSLLAIIRKNKQTKDGEVPVYLRITCNGRRIEVSVKISLDPSKWNPAKGRVKGNTEEARRLNQSIETFEHRAREIYNRFILAGKLITADAIKNELILPAAGQHCLVAEMEKFVVGIEGRIGNGYSAGTVRNWKVTLGHLKEFLKQTSGLADIPFKELSLPFLHSLELYAATQWHCRTNATLKHIERIRKIVNQAVAFNWLEKDPFATFQGKHEKTHRTFLTQTELDKIEAMEIAMSRLARVRDIFLFSCYTGLAYVDVEKLTPANLVIGIDKKRWIYTFREKTGNKSNIPLLAKAADLVDKYSAEAARSGRLLPVITNIKTNAYLKEIGDICELKKNLTFHMARHTFATTVTLSNGVPMETVSNMLGHSKITTTQIYAKVLENKVSSDMLALERKLSDRS
jgi:site-specific recombinase XerD